MSNNHHYKKVLSLILSVIMVLSCITILGGCDNNNNVSVETQKQTTAETTISATSAPMEEFTETPTNETLVIETKADYEIPDTPFNLSVSEYVETEMERNLSFQGRCILVEPANEDSIASNRLPKLKIDSEDAKQINEEIHEKYYNAFINLHNAPDNSLAPRIDYVVYKNSNVLSLVIEYYLYRYSTFSVYNIDLNTGNQLDKTDIITMAGQTVDNVNALIINAIEDQFKILDNAGGYINPDELKYAQEKSYSDENINETQFCFIEEGKLIAIYSFYWIAGSGFGTDVLITNSHIQ